jgi:hypothetical protein
MNMIDAAYATAHDYPGGTVSLAPRLGMSSAVLRGKVNPNDACHKLTLSEALNMQILTGDTRILHAMADELNFVCIPGGTFDDVADDALLDLFSTMIQRLGYFSRAFHDALSDGRVTEKEFESIRTEFYSLQASGAELLSRVESLTEKRPTSNRTSSK